MTTPNTSHEPAAVVVLTHYGLLQLVLGTDPCTLCRGDGQITVWNPDMRDDLTVALTPVDRRTWTLPCPVCWPEGFATSQETPR